MQGRSAAQKIVLSFVAIIMATGLTGCFKGDFSVDIKANGTGVVSLAFGMTQEAKNLVASEGVNPFQDMRQSMSDGSSGTPKNVEVTQWRDGDYEWSKATKEFESLEEINKVVLNRSLFNSFSITRERGIFQDEFILDAEMDSINSDMPTDDSGIDPAAFIEMRFSARLPGTIVESNGFSDINDPNVIVWSMASNQTTPIYARSTTWNWLNISGILVFSFAFILFAIYALGGFDWLLYPPKRKPNYLPQGQQALPAQDQHTLLAMSKQPNYIDELGTEDLLNQVNKKALNSSGEIRRKPKEMALLWKDAQGQQKFIYIKDLGNHHISVNGVDYPATRDNAKAGIVIALNKQK